MFCSNCGNKNVPDSNFCSSCGNRLAGPADDATVTFQALDLGNPQAEDEIATELADLSSDEAMLFVKRGTNAGATYLLDKDTVVVGRSPDADIFLDDVTVSRRHAEFQRTSGQFELRDLGSLNGTYVNGESIETKHLLRGDEVQIGKFKLVFLLGTAGGEI